MPIESTEHLSKLSSAEIKEVSQKWPNPLTPVAAMIGGLAALMFAVSKTLNTEMPDSEKLGILLGGVAVFLILTLGALILSLIKLSKAKKILATHAQTHGVPMKGLLKDFKKNLKHIRKL